MCKQYQYKVDPMVIQTLKDAGEFDHAFFYKTSINQREIDNFLNEKSTLIEYNTAREIAEELDLNWKLLIRL